MKLKFPVLAAALLFLTGCNGITSTATIYQGKNHMDRGTVAFIPVADNESNSLENKTIGDYILTKLAANGYTPTEADQKPEFTTNFKYKLSRDKAKYKGNFYLLFEHSIEIEIYKSLADGKKEKEYELKVVYNGRCGNINPSVKMRMIDAIFLDFPGVNGQSNKHSLSLNQGESKRLMNPC
ncbi:MAG: DUF4136 domain-containing protein [Alphaproteobacteria bacterium]|nr:DUF4136 domain-containing protein [Alphaproteobacteria bacterium]